MQAMILKTLSPIQKNFNVIARKAIFRGVLAILLIGFIGNCQTDKNKNSVIEYEKERPEAQVSYAQVGKEKLSDYGFFHEPIGSLKPAQNVFPYELNTPLFTDYALKKRFIYVPEGLNINFQKKEVLEFPVGTVLIKNFYYDADQLSEGVSKIIETRLLIHEENGWKALPYIWNEEQTDAFLEITGGEQVITINGKNSFNYAVPNMVQCKGCHELSGAIAPIGPTARQLNRILDGKNQLEMLKEAGFLINLPDISAIDRLAIWNDKNSGSLENRARAYLEINCGHCHRPEGPGKNSGLDLTIFSESDHSLGIHKSPVAAGAGSGGHSYDIVPGSPESSIFIFRMESTQPGVMMPELGRKLVHTEGVELIKEWIKSMK